MRIPSKFVRGKFCIKTIVYSQGDSNASMLAWAFCYFEFFLPYYILKKKKKILQFKSIYFKNHLYLVSIEILSQIGVLSMRR